MYFRSIDPSANRFRWYSLEIQPCLFGGVDLIRRWGRIGQHGGAQRADNFPDEQTAAVHVQKAIRRREQRDYVQVG